jgi:hypothetical protein
MDRIGNNRRAIDDDSSPGPNVDNEVSKLIKENFRNGNIPASYVQELRRKYNDDQLIDKIQDAYYEKVTNIRRRALKFTKLIEKKYGGMGYPLHIVLNKALKYKKKYNLSEPEFEMFRQTYQKNMDTRNKGKVEILAPNTNMAKVFGDPAGEDRLVAAEGEYKLVKNIIELHDLHRALHSQVLTQSLIYDEKDIQSINGSYDPKQDDGFSYIHPVVAAMFLPKIKKFDEYFLFSNLAYIVKAKQNKESLVTYHNYIMLYNLVTEPTDVVCHGESPIADILNRVTLQFNLWKNVLRLRQGAVYDSAGMGGARPASDLMNVVDNCRINNYDAPDLMLVGDESVILRRLINAFAFRSAVVVTSPFVGITGFNGMNLPVVATQVIKVPMLHLRLPMAEMVNNPTVQNLNIFDTPISLTKAMNDYTIVFNNGAFQPMLQAVLHIDDVLIFNVPRRTYQPLLNVDRMFQPTNFTNLPKHALGMEKINNVPINVPDYIELPNNDTKFPLRSAVVLKLNDGEENKTSLQFARSSKTFLWNDTTSVVAGAPVVVRGSKDDIQEPPKFLYDPEIAYKIDNNNVGIANRTAIKPLSDSSVAPFKEIKELGVIFIYAARHEVSK